MANTLPAKLKTIVTNLLGPDGKSDAALRRAVEQYAADLTLGRTSTQTIPDDLVSYIDKVVLHAYKVTDADIEQLGKAGYSEDAIFELTACASVGTSTARFERALELMT